MNRTRGAPCAARPLPCAGHRCRFSLSRPLGGCAAPLQKSSGRSCLHSRLHVSAEEFEQEEAVLEAAVEELVAESSSLEAEKEEEEEVVETLEEGPVLEGSDAVSQVQAVTAAPEAPAREIDRFSLNFLWMDKNIGVAVDHFFTESSRSPLTEYFFWPRTDAWEELKATLEKKPWISERDKVLLLNKTTEVINFWQDEEEKHTLKDAVQQFPDCKFDGH